METVEAALFEAVDAVESGEQITRLRVAIVVLPGEIARPRDAGRRRPLTDRTADETALRAVFTDDREWGVEEAEIPLDDSVLGAVDPENVAFACRIEVVGFLDLGGNAFSRRLSADVSS